MESTYDSMESIERPRHTSEPKLEPFSARSSSPLLSQSPPNASNGGLTTKLLVIAPLVLHLVGSVAITVTLIYALDGHQFYLDRQPRVKLADGTYESNRLGRYNILQPDVTTMLSVALMLLRWVTAAWAVPLYWRVVFLLAGRNGLRRRDIKWVTNYGVLPPGTHFRHSHNLLLGLVLIFTLAHYPGSPILTGSIAWVPSSSTIEVSSYPVITITGPPNPSPKIEAGSAVKSPTFSTDLVTNFNTAWDQDVEDRVFKRVVPSVAQLSINSTVENVLVPFFAVTRIEWFPKATIEEGLFQKLEAMKSNPMYSTFFQPFIEQLGQPGAVGLMMNYTDFRQLSDPPKLSLLVNVAEEHLVYSAGCDSSTTVLPNATTVPSFRLNRLFSGSKLFLDGCFAYANITYNAGFGSCRTCRVGAYSTVQNDTELVGTNTSGSIEYAVEMMLDYLPTLTPVKRSLPNPADGIDTYVTAALVRSHSALWGTWNDGYNIGNQIRANSTYKSAVSTLKAEINQLRVGAWLGLQLSVTLAGLVFVWLQLGSKHLLIADTNMVAFDIDSKPDPSNTHEPREMLRSEPKEDGWKVVVASGRLSHGSD